MGSFKNNLLSKELRCFMESMKNTDEWYPLQKQLIDKLADEYSIGKYTFRLQIPRSTLRPQGILIDDILYDSGAADEGNECIHIHYDTEDHGHCDNDIRVRNGMNWTQEQKDDLRLLVDLIHIIISHNIISQLLKKNLSTDMMTGVSNQLGFFTHVGEMMSKGLVKDYYTLFFNVSNFKYVNKIFSHQEGDVILVKYSQAVRSRVSGDEIVGRMGGDNFVALIHKDHLEDFLYQINHLEVFHEAGDIRKKFVFQATTGVASMENLNDSSEIMHRCSMAYQVARRTGQRTVYYSKELSAKIEQQQEAVIHFVDALKNHEFVVYYQPKVCLDNLEICGAEALVRWFRNGVLIPPLQFIPAFESAGNVCELDYYVLEEVCRKLAQWKEEGKDPVTISVNFSRKHLDEDCFVDKVMEIIQRNGIEPKYIEVELTESKDFQDYLIMTEVVKGFKTRGIMCSIDDFGTGYSSLNMLKNTPFDIVKIDRSFIPQTDSRETTKKEVALFHGMMEMIQEMGMNSIAEGVEQKEQIQYLKDAKCYMVQGYVFDMPLTEEDFEQRLVHRKYEL